MNLDAWPCSHLTPSLSPEALGCLHYLLRFREPLDPGKAQRVTGLSGYVDVFHGGLLVVAPSKFEGAAQGYHGIHDGGIPVFRTLREALAECAPWLPATWEEKWARFPVLIFLGGPSHRAGWNRGRGPRRTPGRLGRGLARARGPPRGPRRARDLRGGGLAAERLGRPCPHRVPHRGVPEAAGVLAGGDVGGREGLPAREVAPTCARRGPFQTSGLGATHRDAAGGGAIARNALEPVGMSLKSRPRPDLPRRARPAPRS